jgi:hypothetical protein
MARMKIVMEAPKNEDGTTKENAAAPLTGGGAMFGVVPAGLYTGVITSIAMKEYQAGNAQGANPNHPQGLWDYKALVPAIQVILGERDPLTNKWKETKRVKLNDQDFTLGVVVNDAFYRVAQDGGSPIFKGNGGAWMMLRTLGMARQEGDNIILDFDEALIKNRMALVGLSYAAYKPAVAANEAEGIKAEKSVNWNAEQFKEWLKAQAGTHELPFDTVQALVNEKGMRLKNVVTFWKAFTQEEAERRGYYFDPSSGAVFETHDDFTTYQGLLKFSDMQPTGKPSSSLKVL